MSKIKVLLVKPNEIPEEIEIENTLEAKQKIVGGYIEQAYLPNDDSVVLICNEEGKIYGMPLNRYIGHDIIAGPFLIVGDDYENGEYEKSIEETNRVIDKILTQRMKERIEREER